MDRRVLSSSCLKGLDFSTLSHNQSGLERETLRVTAQGEVASTRHPLGIGHKLTHPSITVDFSEGLLELVTAPHQGRGDMLIEALDLHRFVARHLPGGELMWAMSMPPPASEGQIQIADFGDSLSGRMKEVYRQGLASRYGKIMQIIAGVHFNFSFDPRFVAHMHGLIGQDLSPQECRNRLYFRLIRGFDRYAWVLPYLFGASPVAARSSLAQPQAWLKSLDEAHVYGEFATSLRMSDIGYQSPAQADLNISHRNLADYVRELVLATRTPWLEYERMGVRRGEDWIQLNGNVLQIENEYYSAIRPKQIAQRGERPACALFERGVSYIEVRMLDVDPFAPVGLAPETALFMEVFLLTCLALSEDGPDYTQIDKNNQKLAIRHGRCPDLRLMNGATSIGLRDWLDGFLDDCAAVAERLDALHGGSDYAAAVQRQRDKWTDPSLLPSQRVLEAAGDGAYFDWALQMSRQHTGRLAQAGLDLTVEHDLNTLVSRSFEQASALERQQSGDFAEYVDQYYRSLCGERLASLL